ncbi:MAG: hypothetical protein KKF62_02995 [Bacteroidetes bacterium]|nr:hypothetical protein [Bacteroidota bacterium]MBU1115017.1 hypothetical protein [Bacteroidota bacterium]MBU1799509.1 hypothetical protein [Bacteroidota bacterium]
MNEMLNKAITNEATNLYISFEMFKELADKGCYLRFNDNLETRFDIFGGSNYFDKNKLSFFLLSLVQGSLALLTERMENRLKEFGPIDDYPKS